jgi:hypothetical protein
MKIRLISSYRNSNGNVVFVYRVSGSKSQMTQFIEAQGEYLKYEDNDESKAPLFFTTKYAGDNGALVVTQSGKVVVDTTEENKLTSLMEQHKGTALGDALALQIAARMMKDLSKPAAAPTAEKASSVVAENATENLDAL